MTLVDICNAALGLVGQAPITTIDDATKAARLCKLLYTASRLSMLELREWSFAVRRAVPGRDAEAPAFGFDFQYVVPSASIRIIDVRDANDLEVEWAKEGSRILTDATSLRIRYLTDVTDTSAFSPGFVWALVHRLGAALAVPLAENRTLQNDLLQLTEKFLRDATWADNTQGSPEVPASPTEPVAARY